MYPTVAPLLPAEEKRDAPTSSILLVIIAADNSFPDLKERYLFAMADPFSEGSSLADPAPGKVRETVEVREEGSVTMVKPLGSVVVEGLRVGAAAGEVAASLD